MNRISQFNIIKSVFVVIFSVGLLSCGYYRGEVVSLEPSSFDINLVLSDSTFEGMALREGNSINFTATINDNKTKDRIININLSCDEGFVAQDIFENPPTQITLLKTDSNVLFTLKLKDDYVYRGDSNWHLQLSSLDTDLNKSIIFNFIALEDEVQPKLTLSPSTSYYINSINQSNFIIQGSCSYEGGGVIITGTIGTQNFTNAVICTNATWSKTYNFSTYTDGLLSIHINHTDTTNTYQAEDTYTFFKRTTIPDPPTSITLTQPLVSPSTQSNPTYDLGGVSGGDIVKIFYGSSCNSLIIETTLSAQSNQVTLPSFTQYGSYPLSVSKIDPYGNPSACISYDTVFSYAPQFTVTTTLNPNSDDASIGDGVCANSVGQCSLKAALDEANYGDGDSSNYYWGKPAIIVIQSGTYTLTSGSLILGPTNTTLKKEIYITGNTPQSTVIDGNSQSTLFQVYSYVSFHNLTFKNATSCCNEGSVINTHSLSRLVIDNNIFTTNTGSTIEGILNLSGVDQAEIVDSQFTNNTNTVIGSNQASLVTISNTSIENNTGIAIYQTGVSTNWKIKSSLIANNSNGINFYKCSKCFIDNSTIFNNSGYGLKFYFDIDLNEDFVIQNSTLYNNATTSGSNVIIDLPDPYTGKLRFINSIIAVNNGAKSNCAFVSLSRPVELFYSLFDDTTCGLTGTSILTSTNPQLGSLLENGGATKTLAPSTNSPAKNSGDNSLCLPTDQRGLPRPVGVCDMGAVELQ